MLPSRRKKRKDTRCEELSTYAWKDLILRHLPQEALYMFWNSCVRQSDMLLVVLSHLNSMELVIPLISAYSFVSCCMKSKPVL